MAIINPAAVVEGAALLARQTVSSAISTAIASAAATPSSTVPVTATSLAPTSTESNVANGGGNSTPSGGGGNQNSSQSSPLLFFVALGFGVVFTNLWIIVGVKYCFRYNARSRQMRLTEDGEPINLENMPRPHRRRREKKLMTMEEVNEKFPMMKYKNWVASRAKEGLPTKGGVSAPPSRANSVRSVEGVVPELPPKERDSVDEQQCPAAERTSKHEPKESTSGTIVEIVPTTESEAPTSSADAPAADIALAKTVTRTSEEHDEHSDDEDDEHINAALPPECLGSSGDTCAICIDTLEDDDDVRGLTCGHAFHAVCLDPWLTSRRACCPLCKADYYTPKPRPPVPEAGDASPGVISVSLPAGDGSNRMNMPSGPHATWISIRGNGRMFPVRLVIGGDSNAADQPAAASGARRPAGWPGFFSRARPTPSSPSRGSGSDVAPTAPASESTVARWVGGLRSAIPFRGNQARNPSGAQAAGPVVSGANPAVSPSQLEAGVRDGSR